MKSKKQKATVKEPSLLKQIVQIYYERALRMKAMRLLEKQSWGLEFLAAVVQKAAKNDDSLSITITNVDGQKMEITGRAAQKMNQNTDENIFEHLDDDIAIARYVREHSRR